VDDPHSTVNAVTGINQRRKIVGIAGAGTNSDPVGSYDSVPPYTKFRNISYPNAVATFATGVSSNRIISGYVVGPPQLSGTWGAVRVKSAWTIFKDRKEGDGSDAVTQLLGLNDSEVGVGFYVDPYGISHSFEVDIVNENFTDLHPPAAIASESTGINGKGDVSGIEIGSAGTTGFFLRAGAYYQLAYPGAISTEPRGVNWQDQVVGDYVDVSGIHGFVLTGPTGNQDWQSVDAPKANGLTVITGITNHDAICGYYVDVTGVQHGFVATPQ